MLTRTKISPAPSKRILPVLLIFLVFAVYIFGADPPEPISSQLTDGEQFLDIVRRAKEGDEESFATLYQLYYMPIFRHLYRMVGNEEDAHDLAAVTFTRAWYSLPGINDGSHFRGWLYKIATNAAIDFIRSKKSKIGRHGLSETLKEEHSDEYGTRFEDRVEEQELIRLAMDQVAPKPRACLILYEEGFSLQEIAVYVGMRKNSVTTYICTARRQFLEAYHRLKSS